MQYSREAPSQRYQELLAIYKKVHRDGLADLNLAPADTFSGISLGPHISTIRALIADTGTRTILDYGSGKGARYKTRDLRVRGEIVPSVQEYWGVDAITCYDPAYEPFSTVPTDTFDGIVCTDVMEHLPESDIPWILEEQFRFGRKFVFGNIAAYPAAKTLPNGENAHCTVRPPEWWRATIEAARSAANSSADYLFLVETKRTLTQLLGLRRKIVPHYTYLSNRADWPKQI